MWFLDSQANFTYMVDSEPEMKESGGVFFDREFARVCKGSVQNRRKGKRFIGEKVKVKVAFR